MTINAITDSLSTPRFATYQLPILGGTSPEQCLGIYLWNKQLACAFLPVLQIVEISLRNAIHQAYVASENSRIESHFGQHAWAAKKEAAKEWFVTIFTEQNNFEACRSIRQAKKQLTKENKVHSPENILAKLTFGFWVSLVSNTFDAQKNNYLTLWPKLRADVFPNAVDSQTGTPLSINSIGNELKEINKIRNRLSHHEPLWKNKTAYQVEDIINKVVEHYERCLKIISWINPSNLKLLSLIDNNNKMAELCNLHALWKLKQLPAGLDSIPVQKDWASNVRIDSSHDGEVVALFPKRIMIKSYKNGCVFIAQAKYINKPIANIAKGDLVKFTPESGSGKYPDAVDVVIA